MINKLKSHAYNLSSVDLYVIFTDPLQIQKVLIHKSFLLISVAQYFPLDFGNIITEGLGFIL